MKAYMSTGTHHDSFGYIAQARLKGQAHDEVKRILAETEPAGASYNYNVRMYEPILAEALAAFVAD